MSGFRCWSCSYLPDAASFEIDVDSDGYEVEGAACEDGQGYDLKLDKKFAVVSKRKDYL